MTHSLLPKVVLASVLTLVLSVPALSAAQRRAPGRVPATRASHPITEALLQFWDSVTGLLTKAGCGIDPSGLCGTATKPPADPYAGCTIDPNGHCVPRGSVPASLDAGCGIDPDGRCSSGH
jgi:hypothetical protein